MANEPIKPGKEKVREWLMRRQAEARALPDIEQIRRELGWQVPEAASESPEPVMADWGI